MSTVAAEFPWEYKSRGSRLPQIAFGCGRHLQPSLCLLCVIGGAVDCQLSTRMNKERAGRPSRRSGIELGSCRSRAHAARGCERAVLASIASALTAHTCATHTPTYTRHQAASHTYTLRPLASTRMASAATLFSNHALPQSPASPLKPRPLPPTHPSPVLLVHGGLPLGPHGHVLGPMALVVLLVAQDLRRGHAGALGLFGWWVGWVLGLRVDKRFGD